MRFISTRAHGLLDYVMGIFLIASPWIFGFGYTHAGMESVALAGVGFLIVAYSAFTDYELGAIRSISMPTHLILDIIGGLFLAASPWILDFNERTYLPHVILGVAEIGAALMTQKTPADDRQSRGAGRPAAQS